LAPGSRESPVAEETGPDHTEEPAHRNRPSGGTPRRTRRVAHDELSIGSLRRVKGCSLTLPRNVARSRAGATARGSEARPPLAHPHPNSPTWHPGAPPEQPETTRRRGVVRRTHTLRRRPAADGATVGSLAHGRSNRNRRIDQGERM